MATNYSPKIVTDGLVLCLDAANPKSYPGSGTTWTDLSGNGNDGTLVNGVGFDSGNQGSLTFDGVNDYVDCGNIFNAENQSLTGMVNSKEISFSKYNAFLDKLSSGGSWRFHSNNGNLLLGVRPNAGGYTTISSGAILSTNIWYNLAFSYNSATNFVSLFVNGLMVTSGTLSLTPGSNGTPLRIGRATNNGVYSNFNMGGAMLYDRALTEAEIKQNFNALRGRYGI